MFFGFPSNLIFFEDSVPIAVRVQNDQMTCTNLKAFGYTVSCGFNLMVSAENCCG